MKSNPIQGSLFEEDFLIRTLGSLVNVPDIALTELVANGWDAGASRVRVSIPRVLGEEVVVEDDGSGMSADEFVERWMTLGYDRVKHQGKSAEFPPERQRQRRPAFGHNGVGRHGMLCFAPTYEVETRKDGQGWAFRVTAASGKNPFVLLSKKRIGAGLHGTVLRAMVLRNLPDAEHIRNVLSARFLQDPGFTVEVNGRTVPLTEQEALMTRLAVPVGETLIELFLVDSARTARTTALHGVAFWVSGRLVGDPSWQVGQVSLLDGRLRYAKRFTIIVRCGEDFLDEVLPDWSGFRRSQRADQLLAIAAESADALLRQALRDRVEETKESALREQGQRLASLPKIAQVEAAEFVDQLLTGEPTLSPEVVRLVMSAFLNLEGSRSGRALLEKFARISPDDAEGLNRLLDEWTVKDALSVLDEIDARLRIIDLIERLSGDKNIDELHTLHPLIVRARWLFGPEYDSPEFVSNVTLRTAIEEIFHDRVEPGALANDRSRPDLLVLRDATLSAFALEDLGGTLNTMRHVLLIELKRGDSTIGRREMDQATNYAEELLGSGLDGSPVIQAFVVGQRIAKNTQEQRAVGTAKIKAATYGQLVRTADTRFFRLRQQLGERYDKVPANELLARALPEHVLPLVTSLQ